MKKAVVFYSMDGNTRALAKQIAQKFEADVFELEETKKRPEGMKAFMGAGFQAFFGVKTKLKDDFSQQMDGYDMIYIGTPIWAAKQAPAVSSFMAKLKPLGKELYGIYRSGRPGGRHAQQGGSEACGQAEEEGSGRCTGSQLPGREHRQMPNR